MALGTVKCFDHSKGIGWIRERGGRDVYVHFSAIREDGFRTLREGEEVEFEVRETDRGLHAHNVFRH
jgi:CspA family cold shock protein